MNAEKDYSNTAWFFCSAWQLSNDLQVLTHAKVSCLKKALFLCLMYIVSNVPQLRCFLPWHMHVLPFLVLCRDECSRAALLLLVSFLSAQRGGRDGQWRTCSWHSSPISSCHCRQTPSPSLTYLHATIYNVWLVPSLQAAVKVCCVDHFRHSSAYELQQECNIW